MTGLDFTLAGTADERAVSARLIDAIEAVIGPSLVIDTAFPRASLAGSQDPGALRIMGLPFERNEQEFWRRFRQAGGHEPIVPVAFGSDTFAWPPPSLHDRSRRIVVAFPDLEAARFAAPSLRDPATALLFAAPGEDWSVPMELGGYDTVLLRAGRARPFVLMLPREPVGPVDDRVVHFDNEPHPQVIEAAELIHDGGYRSEGDAKYSWLWTGPSNHFRLVLPKAATSSDRLAEICFPRTEDPINLDRLAVQVNGRPVAFGLDRWSETSGKAKVPLSGAEETWVVTLVVPRMTEDGQSDRRLGLCLDKVILQP